MKVKKEFQKMFRCRFLLLLIAGFAMGQSALAQAGAINASGTVKDAKGEPLMGVSIAVEGTEMGTVTDFDGNFTLSAPEGSTFKFSYMGFQEKKMRAAATMNVVLQDDVTTLAAVEVVAIGMGTARRGDLTGAIASVNASEMRQGVITSGEQLLQGRIAGLNVVQASGDPTNGAQLRLRGGSSISGENSPLVVVDGVPNVELNSIPAADIVSIDVLKDASAAAIYGSRAANGVILVTTKRKSTDDVVSTSGSYSGYFGVSRAANKLDILDANQWRTERSNNGIDREGNTDWQDAIQRTALTQSHSATFSNNSRKGGFKGSISYLNAEGIVNTSKMERLGGTLSGWTNLLNDRVTVELGLSKIQDNYRDVNGVARDANQRRLFQAAYQANPTWPVFEPDRQTLYKEPGNNNDMQNVLFNPLNFIDNFDDDRTRDRFMGYAKADVWFLKGAQNEGLKGTAILSTNSTDTQERRYWSVYEQRQIMMYPEAGRRGRADRTFGHFQQEQIETYLNYDKSWDNQKHRFNAMAGYSYAKEGGEGFGIGTQGYDFDHFGYDNLAASKNLIIDPASGFDEEGLRRFFSSGGVYSYSYKDESKLTSFFGRANYSYASKYMVTATMRADGSSKFGANHKWGYFPSVSLAWRITEESFMEGTKNWLSDLKLRAGYGVTGNQGGITSYNSIEAYEPGEGHPISFPVTDDNTIPTIVYVPARNANPDLKWESTGQFNVGLDFSLFRGRLSGTVEAYHKKTTDLLYYREVDAQALPRTLMNVGELQNQGIEFSLNGTIIKKDNFSWTANLILAHNKNEYLGGDDRANNLQMGPILTADWNVYENMQGGTAYTQRLRKDYSIGSFFGAKTDGLDENGNIIYLHADGSRAENYDALSADERDQYLGCAMPKLTMGFGMNFNYRKFDLSINTNTMLGQKVYNATAMILSTPQLEGGREQYVNQLSSSLGKDLDRNISDYWLEDASFFRIQTVTLGYTFDLKEKTKNAINSLRLYGTVDNLFVFTNYKGVDPEVSIEMNVTARDEWDKRSPGIDNFDNYPKPRTFLVGVNVQF